MEQVRSSAEEEINEDAASERGGSGPGRLADRKEKLPRSIGEFDFSGQKAAKTRPSWLTPSVVRIHSYPSFSRAILQVFKPPDGQLGISSRVSDTNPFPTSKKPIKGVKGRFRHEVAVQRRLPYFNSRRRPCRGGLPLDK